MNFTSMSAELDHGLSCKHCGHHRLCNSSSAPAYPLLATRAAGASNPKTLGGGGILLDKRYGWFIQRHFQRKGEECIAVCLALHERVPAQKDSFKPCMLRHLTSMTLRTPDCAAQVETKAHTSQSTGA